MLCLLIPANSIHNEKLYCMSSLYIYSPVNIQVTAYIPTKDLSELEAFVCVLNVPYKRAKIDVQSDTTERAISDEYQPTDTARPS